jgi:hypothetical protein
MAERLRNVFVAIKVETNKRTHEEVLALRDEETVGELAERVRVAILEAVAS